MHLELGPSETELPASLRGVSRPMGRSSSEPVGDPNGACFGACGSTHGNDAGVQGDAGRAAGSRKGRFVLPPTRLCLAFGPVWVGFPPSASPPRPPTGHCSAPLRVPEAAACPSAI